MAVTVCCVLHLYVVCPTSCRNAYASTKQVEHVTVDRVGGGRYTAVASEKNAATVVSIKQFLCTWIHQCILYCSIHLKTEPTIYNTTSCFSKILIALLSQVGTFGSSVRTETPDETISRIARGEFHSHADETPNGVDGTASGGGTYSPPDEAFPFF